MEVSQLMSCFNVTTVVYHSGTLPLYQLNCVIKSSQIILNTTEAENMTCTKTFYLIIGVKVSKGNRFILEVNKMLILQHTR